MNLPAEPVPALHKMLKEDWQWATKEGVKDFDLDYLLYITKVARDTSVKTMKKMKGVDDSTIFYKFEDSKLEELAEHVVVFNSKVGAQLAGATNPTEYTMKSELQYQKVIMLVPFNKYLAAVDQFSTLLGEFAE